MSGSMRLYDDVRAFRTTTEARREALRSKLPKSSVDRNGRYLHFWNMREGMKVDGPIVVSMPRNAYSAELWGELGDHYQHLIIMPRKALPETVVAALPGRTGGAVFDHWMFAPGSAGATAIITRVRVEVCEDEDMLVLVFDRAVHPPSDEVRMRIEGADRSANGQSVVHFLNGQMMHLWSAPDDDFDTVLAEKFGLDEDDTNTLR